MSELDCYLKLYPSLCSYVPHYEKRLSIKRIELARRIVLLGLPLMMNVLIQKSVKWFQLKEVK